MIRAPLRDVPPVPRRWWWITFAFVALAGLLWAVATPVFASPDEPSHVIRAVAAAHGQLRGEVPRGLEPSDITLGRGGREGGRTSAYLAVRVPEIYGEANWGCFAFYPDATAECLSLRGSSDDAPVLTPVARYPPLYYVLVGLPSLVLPPGSLTVYAMRAAAVALMAALSASAALSLRRTRKPAWSLAGLLVALTPMSLFLGSTVNPSGLEAIAGIALWASGVVLVLEAENVVDPRVVHRAGLAACLLVLTRQLGPLWLVLTIAVLALLSSGNGRARLRSSPAARFWTAVLVASIAAQGWWLAWAKPLAGWASIYRPDDRGWPELARSAVGETSRLVHEMVGVFGWLDTPSPEGAFLLWVLAIGALVGLALAVAPRPRLIVAIGMVSAAGLLVPVALELAGARQIGLHYQGRYTLPLAAGVPLLAGIAVGIGGTPRHSRRLVFALGAAVATAQLLAFGQALRRYTVGASGSLAPWSALRWSPPLPVMLLLVGALVGFVGLVTWLLTSQPVPADDRAPENRLPGGAESVVSRRGG